MLRLLSVIGVWIVLVTLYCLLAIHSVPWVWVPAGVVLVILYVWWGANRLA